MDKKINLLGITLAATLANNVYAANPASQEWVLSKIASFKFATQTWVTSWVTSLLNSRKPAFVERSFNAYPVGQPSPGPTSFSDTVSQPTPILFNVAGPKSTALAPTYNASTGTFTISKEGTYSVSYYCSLVLQNNSGTAYDVIILAFYLTDASLATGDTIPKFQTSFTGQTVAAFGSPWGTSVSGTAVRNYTKGQTINLIGQISYAQDSAHHQSQATTPSVSIQVSDCAIDIAQLGN